SQMASATTLRHAALEQIHKTTWHPKWGEERIAGMVENRPDWCISRQRMWGVPITVLYCEKCNEPVHSPELFAKVKEIFSTEGADAWYERPASDFYAKACKCGGTEYRTELDILDVWFDSGSSHIAVLKKRPELTWPAAVYIEGHDQHRGWFQSSLLIGTGIEGGAPFEQVVTCGFILNEAGDKMSKSKGNALSPQDVIKQYGADILRLWVSVSDYTSDIPFGPQILAKAADSYLKIRNSGARYLLGNLTDFDPEKDAVPLEKLHDFDKWALDRATTVFERCRRAYEDYDFHLIYQRILDFVTVDLSKIYVDVAKDIVYIEAPASHLRRSAQTVMYHIVRGLAQILAPVLSFTADEIYDALPGPKERSVHLADFPALDARLTDGQREAWDRILQLREEVNKVLENARDAKQIGKSLEADINIYGDFAPASLLGDVNVDLARIFIVSHVNFRPLSEFGGVPLDVKGIGKAGVGMEKSRGKKCGRCWNYREEVTEDGYPCARCQAIMEKLAIPEEPTV
ncbi:MAG TPA: class I tRNA ligase family protein, partial [Thermoanaerobaculia bacterium]|nr:class I tRNA ligase family protein [Thermoanaerobaculia bacterium]